MLKKCIGGIFGTKVLIFIMNIDESLQAMRYGEDWLEAPGLGTSSVFYMFLCDLLFAEKGSFSIVLRTNPFQGPYTDHGWIQQWHDVPCEIASLPDWLGTNVTYYRNGLEECGSTEIRTYHTDSSTEKLLLSAQTIFSWAPPVPDDFAAYSQEGKLFLYANRHESEVFIRKKTRIGERLLAWREAKLTLETNNEYTVDGAIKGIEH